MKIINPELEKMLYAYNPRYWEDYVEGLESEAGPGKKHKTLLKKTKLKEKVLQSACLVSRMPCI
jgi:hypothetical protein